jgi:hypothetical protein
MNLARTFTVQAKGIRLAPFKPAIELERTTLEGELIRLPLLCGKHESFYPAALAGETLRTGTSYSFLTGCECPMGYIVRTEADGAHVKKSGEPIAIEAAYEALAGQEYIIEDRDGVFFFKQG